ncbi:hypothetical protein [Pandoraea sputorum]|uniref:Uncharacterized protein n=1 Tax=Pandoraea sputorum TaxID=93222 RepID=A0A5E5AMJ6_9BURK|nr:hypothetical protein [Pandoraea sputorum]VVE73805.1 hypothetical protein PSP31121_00085 [Pandoraea sputorum]
MRYVLKYFRLLLIGGLLVHTLSAWAISGADLADTINQRYQKSPTKCFVNSPVQECSGVLMRVPPSFDADFWALSAEESATGIAYFDYVRRDIETSHLGNSVGFVLADRPTAAGNGQPYDLRCGCPPPGSSGGPPCDDCQGQPNRTGVSLWDPATPDKLAVQAIFYDIANGGQLSTALQYQRQYYVRTGQWVPILRVGFGTQGTTTFGYDERDQLDYGIVTVANLNARYADTRKTCPGGRSAYYCNGVIIRVTGWATTFHSWNPSPGSVNALGVPFSYVRTDARVDSLYWHANDAGIIMNEFSLPVQRPMEMRCMYAQDAGTSSPDRCARLKFCKSVGVTTVAAFVAYMQANAGSLCRFDVDPDSIQLSLDVRAHLPAGYPYPWNEAILALWPQDVPLEIGIEAFFYMDGDAGGAQFVQRDYMALTGRFMPIVSVDLKPADGIVFKYDPTMQSLSPSGADALPPVPMNPRDIPE